MEAAVAIYTSQSFLRHHQVIVFPVPQWIFPKQAAVQCFWNFHARKLISVKGWHFFKPLLVNTTFRAKFVYLGNDSIIQDYIPVISLVSSAKHQKKQAISEFCLDEKQLRLAANSNDITSLLRLLEKGVNPNASDERDRTAIHFAASHGYTEIGKDDFIVVLQPS